MVEQWLSVTQLSKTLEIPETTVRRYLNNLEEFFQWDQIGRGKKYHPSSVEILQRIAMLYSSDLETIEVKKILADEYAFSVEEIDENEFTNHPPAYDVSGKLDEFQKKQDDFNRQLLQQLNEQQKYITDLVDSRDSAVQEIKRISSEEKRLERLNQIMAEHKVKRMLESEAVELWNNKPDEERLTRVGWLRRGENKDKKDLFIKDYIDEHFEKYLRKEFDV